MTTSEPSFRGLCPIPRTNSMKASVRVTELERSAYMGQEIENLLAQILDGDMSPEEARTYYANLVR